MSACSAARPEAAISEAAPLDTAAAVNGEASAPGSSGAAARSTSGGSGGGDDDMKRAAAALVAELTASGDPKAILEAMAALPQVFLLSACQKQLVQQACTSLQRLQLCCVSTGECLSLAQQDGASLCCVGATLSCSSVSNLVCSCRIGHAQDQQMEINEQLRQHMSYAGDGAASAAGSEYLADGLSPDDVYNPDDPAFL